MLDEMSKKKYIDYDGKSFCGFVDVGDGEYDDDTSLATHALVFMVEALDGSCKVPIGYFFVDRLNGKQRPNFLGICLKKLHAVGATIISLTCDGPECHFSMMNELGACLKPDSRQTFFSHPSDKNKKVWLFLTFVTC